MAGNITAYLDYCLVVCSKKLMYWAFYLLGLYKSTVSLPKRAFHSTYYFKRFSNPTVLGLDLVRHGWTRIWVGVRRLFFSKQWFLYQFSEEILWHCDWANFMVV